MWYWLLVLAGGVLGTGHCIGMCGGFVTLLSLNSPTGKRFWIRQVVYHSGRITTYVMLGGLAGGTGLYVLSTWPWLHSIWMLISGALLILMGLMSGGWIPWPRVLQLTPSGPACSAADLFRLCLRSPDLPTVWLAGYLNGLVPCGLVASYLLLAAGTGDPLTGGLILLVFGIGTIPMLILGAIGIQRMSQAWRLQLQSLAAICVCVTGVLTTIQGWTSWNGYPSSCPYCRIRANQVSQSCVYGNTRILAFVDHTFSSV